MLAGGLDRADRRGCKDAGEVASEGVARGQEPAVSDDLLTDDPQIAESGPQGSKVSAQLFEAQIAAGAVEDVTLSEIVPQFCVVLTGDRIVTDADQTAGQRSVRDEAWHINHLIAGRATTARQLGNAAGRSGRRYSRRVNSSGSRGGRSAAAAAG